MEKETVEKVAKLAMLKLSEEEVEKFAKEFEETLKAFEVIKKANVDDIEPLIQPFGQANVFRKDVEGKSLTQEQALSLTSNKERGYFKGPKVT